MISKKTLLLILIPLVILLCGCAPECTLEDYSTFFPILDSPVDGELLPYNNLGNFDWHHEESCIPETFRLEIWDKTSNEYLKFNVPGDQSEFEVLYTLLPDHEYEWFVQPHGYFFDPDAGDVNSQYVTGFKSQTFTFFTDGRCSVSELYPPLPFKPSNGEWLDSPSLLQHVDISWTYPDDCYPDYFHYQLAADPNFENIITSGITEFMEKKATIYIPQCARVYWRVEAISGITSGGYSETFRFTHSSVSACMQNHYSIDAALIKGFVFEDICGATVPYVPDGVGIWPPCVFGEPYGVHGDGNRAHGADGESGIEGVLVDLGAGPCPSTGLDQFVTQSNGMYYFMVQSPGEYCVSVDKSKNLNLMNGIWTKPLTDLPITEKTLTFGPSETLKILDIGWDEYDILQINFEVYLTSVCRAGDRKDYREIAYVEKGSIVPILARNKDATWFQVKPFGLPICYISITSGDPKPGENVNQLPIYPQLPPPVPTPTPKKEDSFSCSIYESEPECMADSRCNWTVGIGPSYCVNK